MNTVATAFAVDELISMTNHLAYLNLGYLGICVTIILFIGGLHYVFNIRPLKDKLDAQENLLTTLKEEVDQNLSSSKRELKDDLQKFEKIHGQSITSVIAQKNQKLFSDIEKEIAIFENEFSQKFDDYATEKDENLKKIMLAEIKSQIRDLEKALSSQIDIMKQEAVSSKNEITNIKSDLVDLQIEYHLNKKQVGAAKMIIEKINLCKERGWGIESALVELEQYIHDKKFPTFYLKDLQIALKEVPEEYKFLAERLIKLANENVYDPSG